MPGLTFPSLTFARTKDGAAAVNVADEAAHLPGDLRRRRRVWAADHGSDDIPVRIRIVKTSRDQITPRKEVLLPSRLRRIAE